jgi:hypothetical protein
VFYVDSGILNDQCSPFADVPVLLLTLPKAVKIFGVKIGGFERIRSISVTVDIYFVVWTSQSMAILAISDISAAAHKS